MGQRDKQFKYRRQLDKKHTTEAKLKQKTN